MRCDGCAKRMVMSKASVVTFDGHDFYICKTCFDNKIVDIKEYENNKKKVRK